MLTKYLDVRLIWGLRHFFYKPFAGRLKGIGYLGRPSFVKGFGRLYIGAGFGIFPGWRIEILKGEVTIGSKVRIGNNFFLNCGSNILIGDNVTISANVFIGTTDFQISNDIHKSFREWCEIERPVIIGNDSFIGYGAVLLPGTILGSGCVVGANSVVKGTFETGSVVAGSPARLLWVRK